MRYRLLLVDDEEIYLNLMKEFLEKHGYEVETALSGTKAIELASRTDKEFALIILDYAMVGKDGAEVTREIKKVRPDISILINSANDSKEASRICLMAGAKEYVDKIVSPDEFLKVVARWCEEYRISKEVVTSNPSLNSKLISSMGLIGVSNGLANVASLVSRYRESEKTVLILGESGTGKERIARSLHRERKFRFCAVNCAAYSSDAQFIESELFGYLKGAFTGANKDKKGIFEIVGDGTVFLDEIHTLSYRAQQKLLRALQDKVIRPIGGDREIPVKFRLIAAAKPGLEAMVKSGEFLADLYFRINVLRIEVPPLRQRTEDIAPLVKYFCDRYNKESGNSKEFLVKAIFYFEHYSWPGNVRELENTVERICMTVEEKTIGPEQLDKKFLTSNGELTTPIRRATERAMGLERETVLQVLSDSRS